MTTNERREIESKVKDIYTKIKDYLGIHDVQIPLFTTWRGKEFSSHYTFHFDPTANHAAGDNGIVAQFIVMNLDQCRTMRDAVFILGHELGHALDAMRNPGKRFSVKLFLNGKEYRKEPDERVADAVGLDVARNLNYKNERFRNDVPSTFIQIMRDMPAD